MMQWTPDFTVGSNVLDDDHKAFFSLCGLLRDAQQSGDALMVIESATALLEEYVAGHFLREEMAMRSANYPDIVAHIHEHELFKTQVLSIIADCRQADGSAVLKLAQVTYDWLVKHIMLVDTRYSAWIKDVDVDKRPLGQLLADSYGEDPDNDGIGM